MFELFRLLNQYRKVEKFIKENKQDIEKAKDLLESCKKFVEYLKTMKVQLDLFISMIKVKAEILKNIIKKGE